MTENNLYKNRSIIIKEDGFGIVEIVLSSSILITVVLLSVYATSMRQKVIRESYLTTAIENEIQRDVENIRSIMWSNSYQIGDTISPSGYDFKKAKDLGICKDVRKVLSTKQWKPLSSRNKIINNNLTITRKVDSTTPMGIQSSDLDKSVSNVIYIVNLENKQIKWMSFSISSEVHSWCPPGE